MPLACTLLDGSKLKARPRYAAGPEYGAEAHPAAQVPSALGRTRPQHPLHTPKCCVKDESVREVPGDIAQVRAAQGANPDSLRVMLIVTLPGALDGSACSRQTTV